MYGESFIIEKRDFYSVKIPPNGMLTHFLNEVKTMSDFLAHIRYDETGKKFTQTAKEHSECTAQIAKARLEKIGLGEMGYLSGLLHDMGKFKAKFQEYLQKSSAGEPTHRGSVVHTFAGVRYLLEKSQSDDAILSAAGEIAAYAVGAHHGLFDLCGESKKLDGFNHRLTAPGIGYAESVRNFVSECCSEVTLCNQLLKARDELSGSLEKINRIADGKEEEQYFYLGLLARLILSAVIDGDRSDTAAFMLGKERPRIPTPDWNMVLQTVEHQLAQLSTCSEIDLARRRISEQCRAFAEQPGGILCLNVPTGGGKTLSSLRYALAHAASSGKNRIIFTSPLLSILEQNAAEVRRYVQDDSIILEHHSNVITPPEDSEQAALAEACMEDWNAPIILTTLVQLLNSCFDGKTGSIRRFSALVNSIIVIDEVQTVPSHMLSLFNLAVNFLAEVCHCTVVLCSATQPCLEATDHPLWKVPRDIIPFDADLWKNFERTELIPAPDRKLEEVPDFCRDVLKSANSLLIICNKKAEAETLYQELSGEDAQVFHLSAAMCIHHRRDTISALMHDLEDKSRKTICVSTQVIEAGVNISFEAVIRLTAGMDSVIQAAGRCNRHGESPIPGKVYILNVIDETLGKLADIQRSKCATVDLLSIYKRNPARFDYALSSKAAIDSYYAAYYREMDGGFQDFPVKELGNKTLFDLLGQNKSYCQSDYLYFLGQAFALAGKHFHVFDENTFEVIVPYDGRPSDENMTVCHDANGELVVDNEPPSDKKLTGKELITYLLDSPKGWEMATQLDYLEKAKPYTVSIPRYYQAILEEAGHLHWKLNGTVAVLSEECYNPAIGFTASSSNKEFLCI